MAPIRQLCLTTLVLALLLALWPVVRRPFESAYLAGARAVVPVLDAGDGRLVVLRRPEDQRRGADRGDTEFRLRTPRSRLVRYIVCDSRLLGYQPLALGLALVLASRARLRVKATAALKVTSLVALYVLLRTVLVVHHHFTEKGRWFALDRAGANELPALEPSPFLDSLAKLGHGVLHPPPMCYLVPVVIWFLVTHWSPRTAPTGEVPDPASDQVSDDTIDTAGDPSAS